MDLDGFSISNFKKNFKEKAGMDFLDFTIGIEEKWKKEKPGEDVPFKAPGLAINTAEKNAAKKLPGVTPSKETPKSDSKKEKEEEKKEPKSKSEPKSEPKPESKPEPKSKEKSEDEEKADKAVGTKKSKAFGGKVEKLAQVEKEMKELAKEFKASEGSKKETIKDKLKKLSTDRIELQKELDLI